jgi:predicted ATP-grasp superfamily ATP-dependent carboligase
MESEIISKQVPAVLPNCHVRVMEGIIGSLGRRNIPIIALSHKKDCPSFHSRYVKEKHVSPPSWDDGDRFIEFLIERIPGGVLFASDDQTALLFSKHRETLIGKGFLLNFPSKNSLLRGFDKWECYKVAKNIGIPCAYTQLIENGKNLSQVQEKMDYPFILKPTKLAGGNYVKVNQKEELKPAYEKMKSLILEKANKPLNSSLICQEWLEYDMEDIWCVESYYDCRGNHVGFFPIRKERTVIFQEGTFGSRLYAGQSIENTELSDLSRMLLDSLKWRGIAHLDWVFSKKRKRYFLTEINPRLPGFSAFPAKAGFEMAYYYYADLVGIPFEYRKPYPAKYFEMLRYPGDVSASMLAILRGQYSWKKFIRSYLSALTSQKAFIIDFLDVYDLPMSMQNIKKIISSIKNDINRKER